MWLARSEATLRAGKGVGEVLSVGSLSRTARKSPESGVIFRVGGIMLSRLLGAPWAHVVGLGSGWSGGKGWVPEADGHASEGTVRR